MRSGPRIACVDGEENAPTFLFGFPGAMWSGKIRARLRVRSGRIGTLLSSTGTERSIVGDGGEND